MTLLHSLGDRGLIHILTMEGQRGDFSITSRSWQIDCKPLKLDIEGSANENEIGAMKCHGGYGK